MKIKSILAAVAIVVLAGLFYYIHQTRNPNTRTVEGAGRASEMLPEGNALPLIEGEGNPRCVGESRIAALDPGLSGKSEASGMAKAQPSEADLLTGAAEGIVTGPEGGTGQGLPGVLPPARPGFNRADRFCRAGTLPPV
jgi:hypothetical protein